MISLPVQKLRPGMIVAQGVYNKEGASYLTRGTTMNDQYIDQLKKIGINSIAVTSMSSDFKIEPPEEIIQERTRVKAIHRVYGTFEKLDETGELNVEPLEETSESILVDILSNKNNLVQLTDIRKHDDYTFAHCVNVSVLSGMLGSIIHLERQDMLNLILGGLLHDIGKLVIPHEILTKTGRLNDNEFNIIKMHPKAGRDRLRTLPIPSAQILATIAMQHHEHMDGRGYPNHVMGDAIHRFSRIVAIADVYDALTSRRAYKPAYKPHIAFKIMTKCSPGQFDEDLLQQFFNNIAIYPVGTVLKTTLGYGIVKSSTFGYTLTPTICVFADGRQNLLQHPFDVDLRSCPPDTVQQAVEDSDLLPLMTKIRRDPAEFLRAG